MMYLQQDRALTRRMSREGATWLGDWLFGLTVTAIFVGLPIAAAWAHQWASRGMQ